MPSMPQWDSLAGLFNVMGSGLGVANNKLPMLRDPGMSRGGNVASMGANPSTSIGGNPSGMPMLPVLEKNNAESDLTRANELEKEAYGMRPDEVRSNIGTKDILALLFAGLAGSEGGNVLQGYMQGKQAAQAQREAQTAQKYQLKQQEKLQEAASIRAGIPIKQSQIDKRNEETLNQFKTLADIYNKGQTDLTKKDIAGQTNERILSVEDKKDQTRRWIINQQLLDKKPYTYRAQWAMENLDITDPDILERLGKPNADELNKIAAANNLKAKTDTIVALRPRQIKNLDNRNAYLASQSGLNDKKAITEVARATVLFPAEAALKIAQAKAATMNANTALKRVNAYIAKDGKITDDKKYQKALDAAKTSLVSADKVIVSASTRATELIKEYEIVFSDKSATQEQKDAIETALRDAASYLNTVITDRNYYNKQLDDLQTLGGFVPARPEEPKLGLFGFPDGTFPHVPGKDDISMDKPTATPPKGKTGKMPSGFKRIQ